MDDRLIMTTTDPRIARTRALLASSALKTLTEEGWDAMTPSELSRRAGVGRSTFYLHYSDPSEPLAEGLLERLAQETSELLHAPDATLDPKSLLRSGRPLSYPVYAHVERHWRAYRCLFEDARGAPTLARIELAIAAQSRALHEPLRALAKRTTDPSYLAAVLAGALMGSLRWWVLHASPPPSAVKMSYEFSTLLAPGLLERMDILRDDE